MEDLHFKRKSLFCIHKSEKIHMVNNILSLYISSGKEGILKTWIFQYKLPAPLVFFGVYRLKMFAVFTGKTDY